MLENCRTPNRATVAFSYIYSWGIRIPNILGPLLTDIKPLSRWTSHSHFENSPSKELRMEVLALNDYVKEHRVEESHRELGCAWQCQCLGLWLLSSWAFLAPSSSFTVLFTFFSRTLKAVVSPIHLEFLRNDLEFCQTSGMHAFLSCHRHSFQLVYMSWKPTDSSKDRISCPPVYFQRKVSFKQRILGKMIQKHISGKERIMMHCVCVALYATKSLFLSFGKAPLFLMGGWKWLYYVMIAVKTVNSRGFVSLVTASAGKSGILCQNFIAKWADPVLRVEMIIEMHHQLKVLLSHEGSAMGGATRSAS